MVAIMSLSTTRPFIARLLCHSLKRHAIDTCTDHCTSFAHLGPYGGFPAGFRNLLWLPCGCTETAEGAAPQSTVPAGLPEAVLGIPGHPLILDSPDVCSGTGAPRFPVSPTLPFMFTAAAAVVLLHSCYIQHACAASSSRWSVVEAPTI